MKKEPGRKTKYSKALVKKAYDAAAEGLNNEEIAKSIKISITSLYKYISMYTEFAEAIEGGRKQVLVPKLENEIVKLALGGQEYTETSIEYDKDGRVESKKVVTKVTLPNERALETCLYNRAGKNWKRKQEIEHSGTLGTELVINVVGVDKEAKE